ncbi:vitamin K-dependent gamma-carboxylase-like isoform X2 [Littorina saxatilis]|uniref:vitamin K-dependent gamma-carboxylase-like isoform X2 n=1 Tax=Littorina saxatilis TaxID=31220 RepID=UPI0038B469C6
MERPSKKQLKKGGDVAKCEEKTSSCQEGEEGEGNKFKQLFGFRTSDLTSWNRFVHLMSRPTDPASLACLRFFFGLLMVFDVLEERGLGSADFLWGNEEQCRFPLFSFLSPLPLQWMVMLYFVMWLGAIGIMLGIEYRVSCAMFLLPYWYFILLEKTRWNNHSYLFGIIAFLLLVTDGHHFWSLDGFFDKDVRNADVPLWNYTLFRTQIFLVYFLAGVKKLDIDWVSGYSMALASHWVFEPFKFVMTEEQVDYVVVHLGGLTIDLFVGFLLFFDKTRLMGMLISGSFHLMNSQLFSIGMFPWAMLGTIPLFCYPNWPRPLFRLVPRAMRILTPDDDSDDRQPSPHCLYPKESVKPECKNTSDTEDSVSSQITPPTRPSLRHHATTLFSVLFILWQLFLPFSHSITKGHNSWTEGVYGYSWDMMIHSRDTQHVRITFVDKDTGRQGYLNPHMWTNTWRWASHPDMMKQYAKCIAENLRKHDVNNVELYFDVWISLNKRFQQRIVDPRVDMLTADWNLFKATPWVMPLLADLTDWRGKLVEIENHYLNSTTLYDIVFVADFPGLHLENYVHEDIGNASIMVLQGQVVVELIPEEGSDASPENLTVSQDHEMQIPGGRFHNVYTVSDGPSCYMYLYLNTTELTFMESFQEFELSVNDGEVPAKWAKDPRLDQFKELLKAKQNQDDGEIPSFGDRLTVYMQRRYNQYVRGARLVKGALMTIFQGHSFQAYLEGLNSNFTKPEKGRK